MGWNKDGGEGCPGVQGAAGRAPLRVGWSTTRIAESGCPKFKSMDMT